MRIIYFLTGILFVLFSSVAGYAQTCLDCHKGITPGVVQDWELSKHSKNGVACNTCHGEAHKTEKDFMNAKIPTPETCRACHPDRVKQFESGKHALAWASMEAMPTIHWQPMLLTEGMKGCGGCHKIGLKNEADLKKLREQMQGFGMASCDACHTRHVFSVEEARQPQACKTCHMGFDHPQWEMYDSSKHGVRKELKQVRALPQEVSAPSCQDCHMSAGNHAVRTAWGFLAVRLPMPEDKKWAEDRATILKALGVLDPEGKPTGRLETVKASDVARLTEESWRAEREKMLAVCTRCHSPSFARGELEKGDNMIREADVLMAEAINIVAELYRDGILKKPEGYAYSYPDILTFHDAPTPIEQKLFVMFLEHRMRAFQGTFHASPDYALWYGWSEMRRDLTDIKAMAADMQAGEKE
jgi:hydroxylamine dehydrogenase